MRRKLRISVAAARLGVAGLVAGGVLQLAACGQKGPLTLPKAAVPAAAASVPAR